MHIEPDARLIECPPMALHANIAAPLSERLDVLVTLANGAGASTNRGELLAALLLAAAASSVELLDLVIAYRRAVARDATVEGLDPARILRWERHRTGPRRRESVTDEAGSAV